MHIQTSDQEILNLGFADYTCNWGTHICGFYENKAERNEIVMGFFHEGAINNDVQIYIGPESAEEGFREEYDQRCNLYNNHLINTSLLSFVTSSGFYLPNGKFDVDHMIKCHHDYHELFNMQGAPNVRAAADMEWVHLDPPGIDGLMIYEAALNWFYPGKPWVGICLYNLNMCSGSMIVNILKTHPYVISGGVITANPYYVEPEKYISEIKMTDRNPEF